MKFEEMTQTQRRLHNAVIVLDGDGNEYGFPALLLEVIGEITQLRQRIAELEQDAEFWRISVEAASQRVSLGGMT